MVSKVTTVTVNDTTGVLTMKVGNRKSVKMGGHYTMQVDVNWTYREFLLQDKAHCENRKSVISSDDCCDCERITITENTADGSFDAERELREQFRRAIQLESGHDIQGPDQEKFVKTRRFSALTALEKRGPVTLCPARLPGRRGRRSLSFSPLRPVSLSSPIGSNAPDLSKLQALCGPSPC